MTRWAGRFGSGLMTGNRQVPSAQRLEGTAWRRAAARIVTVAVRRVHELSTEAMDGLIEAIDWGLRSRSLPNTAAVCHRRRGRAGGGASGRELEARLGSCSGMITTLLKLGGSDPPGGAPLAPRPFGTLQAAAAASLCRGTFTVSRTSMPDPASVPQRLERPVTVLPRSLPLPSRSVAQGHPQFPPICA